MSNPIDAMIVAITLICAAFAGGMWIGEEVALARSDTGCVPKAGDELSSVRQGKDGIEYRMRSTTKRCRPGTKA